MNDEDNNTNNKIISMNIVPGSNYWSIYCQNEIDENISQNLKLSRDLIKTVNFKFTLGQDINIRHDEIEKAIEEQWKTKAVVTISNDKRLMFAQIVKSEFKVENCTKEIFIGKYTFTNLSYKHYKQQSMKIYLKNLEVEVKEVKAENSTCNEEIEILKDSLNKLTKRIDILENRQSQSESKITNIENNAVARVELEGFYNRFNTLETKFTEFTTENQSAQKKQEDYLKEILNQLQPKNSNNQSTNLLFPTNQNLNF
ncbi:predicted protein [Naegleria gruberi]|uniref:Predicted protein n=1 Tax=Naegleria gruberi TaxID=5762 RepID=D2W5R9_NAEGR|nr:uncharacterized protein NAEGRDRAFT_76762 [Naegleria gruberi]EFC35583.1 predicted protein [Naegleria gruberi]|eukprot:XP_002668327.1 predicted protein [Naegleria gruberi strain NEG-M]